MEDFGQGLQQLIEKTLAGKTEELKRREIEIAECEKRKEAVLKNVQKGHCELRVGNCVFHTTCETLTRVPESYFASGLLDASMIKDSKLAEPIFIDRDGDVFKFVLEYLQYGQIYTPIPSKGFLRKLQADAKFYLLPELVNQLQSNVEIALVEKADIGPVYLSLSSTLAPANQQFIVWNGIPRNAPSSHFTLSQEFHKITFQKAGLYQIHIRHRQVGSNCLSLQFNGVDIAHCLLLSDNTAQITEILETQIGSYIQVGCGANCNSNVRSKKGFDRNCVVNSTNDLQTRLFVVLLSD